MMKIKISQDPKILIYKLMPSSTSEIIITIIIIIIIIKSKIIIIIRTFLVSFAPTEFARQITLSVWSPEGYYIIGKYLLPWNIAIWILPSHNQGGYSHGLKKWETRSRGIFFLGRIAQKLKLYFPIKLNFPWVPWTSESSELTPTSPWK